MKQLLSSGFRPVLRPEAEMLLRLGSPNDDTRRVRTKLREVGLRPTRTRIALRARPTKSESYLTRFGKERGSRIPLKECRHVAFGGDSS
jgi:hypothetical protein